MKKISSITPVIIVLLLNSSCNKSKMETQQQLMTSPAQAVSKSTNTSGIGSAIPAYYDAKLFNIIFVEFSSTAEADQIAHNKSMNFIYQSDNGLPNNQPFISVIDAIPGDGMNPVWREIQVVFNSGFIPHQFLSDNEIAAAVSGPHPEITLDTTNEVYWCPIFGPK